MKNKNNPKSKKLARQQRAMARWQRIIERPSVWDAFRSYARKPEYYKAQVAILEAKGVK